MVSPDIDEQVMRIGSVLAGRLDKLAQHVWSSVRTNVEFYRITNVVSDQELLDSITENLRFLCGGLHAGEPFDTTPAVATGTARAIAGVPLPAVMEGFRVAYHRLWDALVDLADPQVSREALLRATALVWQAQDVYTDAMTAAYREHRIEERTGRSLSVPQGLAELCLAFEIYWHGW